MGNWFSRSDEDIAEEIAFSEKFSVYQKFYKGLSPSRNLYIEDTNIVIETGDDNSSSIDIISPDWRSPDIAIYVFRHLDRIYYRLSGNKLVYQSVDDFIEDSVDTDIEEWKEWLNTHFEVGSPGYKLFERIGLNMVDDGIYSRQYIWYSLLERTLEEGYYIIDCDREDILKIYPDSVELVNDDYMTVAVISNIDGKYKYTAITSECFTYIQDIYYAQE